MNYLIFTILYIKDDGGTAVCDVNVTAATNETNNTALTVWFWLEGGGKSVPSHVLKGEE